MNGVLVDTSVWVAHFRQASPELISLLSTDRALMHYFVLGELACGTPPAPRTQTLRDLGLMRRAPQANFDEVTDFIERERLYGLGCGFIDITLIASALIAPGVELWTLDKQLSKLAHRFGILH